VKVASGGGLEYDRTSGALFPSADEARSEGACVESALFSVRFVPLVDRLGMSNVTTDQFAQRLLDTNLLEPRQLDVVFGELGSRHVELAALQQQLLRRELMTNWQIDRVLEGHVAGYFYGPYKVLYLVGAGTFARVYRAVHRDSGEVRAVKVLRQRYTQDSGTRDRFLSEAKMVMTLRHPNIVPIYDVADERGRFYMVMDFVEGQNLRDFVKVHGKLKLTTALSITKDIAAGLDHAYQKGITHRDLKLSNVLLSSRGRAMLVDFGLAAAAAAADDKSEAGNNPRSIDYAGLERATGVRRDDKRSDIFFLGCMLYHMLTGKPPLVETKERIQRLSVQRYRDIKPIAIIEPSLPHRTVMLVNQCLELDPEKRVQTPGDAVSMLQDALAAAEAGDNRTYDAELAKKDLEEYRKRELKEHEGRNRTIMLIESHAGMQDRLRDKLKSVGYRVLIFSDPTRGLARFRNFFDDSASDRPADCVIFGCSALGFDALDAFNEFGSHENTKNLPAILVTSEKQGHFANEAKLTSTHVHLAMPIKFRELRRILRKLLGLDAVADADDDED